MWKMMRTFGAWTGAALVWQLAAAPVGAAAEPSGGQALLDAIRAGAAAHEMAPIDAKLDAGGKAAIPGYNGLAVDIERSYELTMQKGGDPAHITYAFRQVPPKVKLDDLGPRPVYRGNPAKPMAALMINVAWGEQHLPHMLEVLEKEGVRCTFFFDGKWLNKHTDEAKRIGALGHELSNHAYSHRNMSELGDGQAREEIAKTEQLLTERLGVRNTLFAPPSGDYSMQTVKLAHAMKLRTVLWTVDTIDWKNPPADAIVAKIARKSGPGTLVLMHPTPSSSAALQGMIRELKRKGLTLGTVSEVIAETNLAPAEKTL
ncbi:polysaccharide deacetylase family protein [Paenibacillus cymbidii]|uniref:polysaccharide deacetylase family protein n=1 Tax=Paenibacillus cymbidii TaxID=1639034 RepID=UPI001081C818|nr:polysaccharide deacetylase family protein [Paenibacillus cymbidii]